MQTSLIKLPPKEARISIAFQQCVDEEDRIKTDLKI